MTYKKWMSEREMPGHAVLKRPLLEKKGLVYFAGILVENPDQPNS
jgi:hypothetical protein